MKNFCVSFCLVAALITAVPGLAGENDAKKKERRLERINWNPITCELSWVVSEGRLTDKGEYVVDGRLFNYKIHMDAATMTNNVSSRRFSKDEANQVHMLLNALKTYAEQSTEWWDAGKGEKLDKQARVVDPPPQVRN